MGHRKKFKSQSKWFYTPNWPRHRDIRFISCLAWYPEFGHKQVDLDALDLEAIDFARDYINERAEHDYCVDFYLVKLHLLRQCYTTFKRIVDDPAFCWNPLTNRVVGSKASWDALFKENYFAKAYRYRGEALYKVLQSIFDPDYDVNEGASDGDAQVMDSSDDDVEL
ncbi:hypothetical protein Salat_2701800 [Sesamum alatum]|uniref:Uncharacterized protein n=1 Tax=Sesamum alatum TaxID=300844 RepID=A0AAE1XQ04_9LAMI|nr:hypothetical protein Salat_2701800 [Sesamum alatum]